jgi:hypothetical protein
MKGAQGKSVGLLLILTILNCICISARGDTLSLPLKGYFHPGRAMPVQWDTSTETIQLSVSGAITSRVQTAGNPHGVFPWLVIDQNTSGSTADLPPLHPLEDSDCLIASTLDDDSSAASLFPNRHVIFLHPPNGIEGPAMAWETLDAILLTPDALAKISPQTQADLFAAGVELAVIGDVQPDAILPWRHNGRGWIASSNFRLPPPIDTDAYAPTDGWNPGRADGFRMHIFLNGVIFCLIISGIALWRSRLMPPAIIAVSLGAMAVFSADNDTFSPVSRRDGIVRLTDEAAFDDHWVYQVSHRTAWFTIPIEDSIHPVCLNSPQCWLASMTIECDGHGQPVSISGRLLADQPLALMTRRMQIAPQNFSLVNPPTSPMRLLASDPIYRGFRLQGELGNPVPPESWPGIVMRLR